MRGATVIAVEHYYGKIVSIHAPMRGATKKPRGLARDSRCFNPRAHAGRDVGMFPVRLMTLLFQSTRPCGARRHFIYKVGFKRRFNPRAHAGRDLLTPGLLFSLPRFNPRAHAGRDINMLNNVIRVMCFNPRAHAGRDALCFGSRAI